MERERREERESEKSWRESHTHTIPKAGSTVSRCAWSTLINMLESSIRTWAV